MPIMASATRRSRSSTEYSFLLNRTADGALKSISVTLRGDLCDRQKTEYKSLAMKVTPWIKDSTFYQSRKEVYQPRKTKFFKPRLNASVP